MNPPIRDRGVGDDHRGAKPSIDEVLDTLRQPLRRDVIEYFASTAGNMADFEDVVDDIATKRTEAVDRNDIEAVLHHRHLPKMAEQGVIEFDPRSGKIRYQPDDLVEEWLERIQSESSE